MSLQSFDSSHFFFCELCQYLLMCFHLKSLQFVGASQPINALAFIFDGLHYGVSDFAYAARSMVCL